jgi:hypothetical protein
MAKPLCDKNVSFADCELAILRMAVDNAEAKLGKRKIDSEEVKQIIEIIENFIKQKGVICYGGTAINNILPVNDQFYNKDIELPDYDFFTPNALSCAKELADLYHHKGFIEVEAKSGVHHGTYKVFVNFMPIADITFLPKEIFNVLRKESIRVDGILYAPPNYLRMSMYSELSKPVGEIDRWEKVLKRLTILNNNFAITDIDCNHVIYQRKMENENEQKKIFDIVKNVFIDQGVVFFGGFAISMYSRYMKGKNKKEFENIADFDVLSNDPKVTAVIVKERLLDNNISKVKIIKNKAVGEMISENYEIKIGEDSIAFIYHPIGCHSYNNIKIHGKQVKIASIDTMLSFYLAFLYTNRPYYNDFLDRILCTTKLLFNVQQHNRLEQKGILKRFSITCYGHQESLEEIRSIKSKKYKELKESKNKKEMEEWFLNYVPKNTKSEKLNSSDNKTRNNKSREKISREKITRRKKSSRKKARHTKRSFIKLY